MFLLVFYLFIGKAVNVLHPIFQIRKAKHGKIFFGRINNDGRLRSAVVIYLELFEINFPNPDSVQVLG